MWLLSVLSAHAGPNTAIVGVEADFPMTSLAPFGAVECLDIAPICIVEGARAPDLQALSSLPGVRYVEADAVMDIQWPVQPPQLPAAPWDGTGTSECPDLWELELLEAGTLPVTGVNAPVVAIEDAGFYWQHEDFGSAKISGQFDYGDSDTVPEVAWAAGVPGHGTFIAGMLTAIGDNGIGRAGLGPDLRLNLQKIADSGGNFYWSYAIRAMDDLADGDLGVRVLNYSIASSSTTTGFTEAVAGLGSADILLVAAAGNCGYANCTDANNDSYPLYPANLSGSHILSVAGSTETDDLNTWSHYGPATVDLAAPGVSLCSLGVQSTDDYDVAAGTSYAAPLVAAAAALVFEAHPDLSAVDVARVLKASAVEVGDLPTKVAHGRLSVHGALATAVPGIEAPSDGYFDTTGSWSLNLENRGAVGQATVVLTHDAKVQIQPENSNWTATPFVYGESVVLPDAGAWTATSAGTLLVGTLPEHSQRTVGLTLRATQAGDYPFTARLVLSSEGADYLNAPYASGSADPTGFLAHDATWSFDQAWVDTGPMDSDTGDSTVPDSDPQDDPHPVDSGEDSGSETQGGCGGCGGTGGGGALVVLGGLALLLRRRP